MTIFDTLQDQNIDFSDENSIKKTLIFLSESTFDSSFCSLTRQSDLNTGLESAPLKNRIPLKLDVIHSLNLSGGPAKADHSQSSLLLNSAATDYLNIYTLKPSFIDFIDFIPLKIKDSSRKLFSTICIINIDWSLGPISFIETLTKQFGFLKLNWKSGPRNTDLFKTFVHSAVDAHSGTRDLPLPKGLLTENIGIPIVVIASNSDALIRLERDYSEEQFDYIQQAIRCLCLKYGAAYFTISQARPETSKNALSYLLHLLSLENSSLAEAHLMTEWPNKFKRRDADREVYAPFGWDSVEKIKILNSEFPWELYCFGQDEEKCEEFKAALGDGQNSTSIRNLVGGLVKAQDEQTFLSMHLESFKGLAGTMAANETDVKRKYLPPTVSFLESPKKSNTVKIPTTSEVKSVPSKPVKAPEDDVSAKIAKLLEQSNAVKEKYASTSTKSAAPTGTSGISSTDVKKLAARSSETAGGSQNELLSNFFQSLLKKD